MILELTMEQAAAAAVLDDRMARFDAAIAARKHARITRYSPASKLGHQRRRAGA